MKACLVPLCMIALVGFVGCRMPRVNPRGRPATGTPRVYDEQVDKRERGSNAARAREKCRNMTFAEFKATVWREPEEYGGKFLVNGDQPILDEKHLEDFFKTEMKGTPVRNRLVVHSPGGQSALWNDTTKRQLTYCVSTSFGARHDEAVQAMDAAASAWEESADIDFVYVDAEDDDCVASNSNVVFDVRPVNVNGNYLARAFFPNDPRSARNVLIDESSFELGGGNLTLTGILRHELGHTLGFRHEHTRPESGACFEDADWDPVTDYDAFSVMHYPQCNGLGNWSLMLTDQDRNGAACVYGPAPGFTIDPELHLENCRVAASSPCCPRTQTVEGRVERSEKEHYGPFAVTPGTTFEVVMTGTGDPDLYIRFGQAPTQRLFNCRPYLVGPNESCSLTVPSGVVEAFVVVRGYTAGTYQCTITRTVSR